MVIVIHKEMKMKKKHVLIHLDSVVDRLLNLISSGDHDPEQVADIIVDVRNIQKNFKCREYKNETT
tara:strand:+ start:213 stop:410 length:198 start_codon:yes stop_codon:yes gene_type:complete